MLLASLLSTSARADAAAALFEADVPVAGQDPASRGAALRAAFAAVLVKVSGTRRVLDNPELAAVLGSAESRVQQFYFRRAEPLPGNASGMVLPLMLHASFQPAEVEALLRGAGEAILPPNRPATLLWLALEDANGALIVNPESHALFAALLRRSAQERAVPVLFPLLDLEDAAAVSIDQVRALDAAAIVPASQRYAPQVVLIGRIKQLSATEWQADWQQQAGEEIRFAQSAAAAPDALAANIVADLAEGLSASYAITAQAGSSEDLRLRIDGLSDMHAYRRVAQLLRGLASVRECDLVLLERDALVFGVRTDASREALVRELSLVPQLAVAGDDPAQLHYRWTGAAGTAPAGVPRVPVAAPAPVPGAAPAPGIAP